MGSEAQSTGYNFANSEGEEDSDEDMITEYVRSSSMLDGNSPLSTTSRSADYGSNHHQGVETSSGPPLVMGDGCLMGTSSLHYPTSSGSLVPTISVTPYSPVTTNVGKQYVILEENLVQLHDIVNSVQRMKDDNINMLYGNSQILTTDHNMRLSCSCPSLNEQDSDSDLQMSMNSSPSFRDVSSSLSTTQFSHRRQRGSCDWATGSGVLNTLSDEALRRKSWSALEDVTGNQRTATDCGSGSKNRRQRSISVSSLDSDDVEDPFSDSTVNLLGTVDCSLVPSVLEQQQGYRKGLVGGHKCSRQSRHSTGGSNTNTTTTSTRSLNEADLKSDFNKIKAICKNEGSLLQTRLPLQKSISTPSIPSVKDVSAPCGSKDNSTAETKSENAPSGATSGLHHPSGTESETEEEMLASLLEAANAPIHRTSFFSYFQDSGYGRQEKRQKRGSIFFRKKKDLQSKIHQAKKANGYQKEDLGGHAHLHENLAFSDETPLVTMDFLNESLVTASDLETDPFLGLQDEEPETWSLTVSKDLIKKLKEKEVKRQEHIYELILTEKHHCLTLRVMQKIFVEGFQKYFNLGINLNRMFPRLLDLTDIHLKFLYLLRERQREAPVVQYIGDILLELFSGESAERLKSAYGEFCSRHRDAVNIYKYYLQHDSKFAMFVKHCQNNPLLKKKGIPECILFVTQRLTKYPLLIEPLIKTSKENKEELDTLTKALSLVKEVLVKVDSKVEEREKDEKKMDIYNKIEGKSFTYFRGKKFKKSSILSNNRSLQFDGVAMVMQGQTKMQMVQVIVLSDILFFLTENNNKLSFFTPYGKEGVISLQKLLVRERAGGDSRIIFLICPNIPNPEMYELKIHKPKEKQTWIRCIRDAIKNCSMEESENNFYLSSEEKHSVEEQQLHVQRIIEGLHQKDMEQAIVLEEKLSLQLKLLAADGIKPPMEPPIYSNLLSTQLDSETIRAEVVIALQRVQELTGCFYNSETSLSRSASSVGERQSVAYISPILPKRAETFGGFDNANKEQLTVRNSGTRKLSQQLMNKPASQRPSASTTSTTHTTTTTSTTEPFKKLSIANFLEDQQISWRNVLNMMGGNFNRIGSCGTSSSTCQLNKPLPTQTQGINVPPPTAVVQQLPLILQMDKEAQPTMIELTSHMYTLTVVIMKQMTAIEALQAQIKSFKEDGDSVGEGSGGRKEKKLVYNHSQQLEELRDLQDKLTKEKEQWNQKRYAEEKELEEKRQQLVRLQEQIRKEQDDVTLQREQLYRKLELLSAQGFKSGDITSSPPSMIPTSPIPPEQPPSPSDISKRRSDSIRWKQQVTNNNKPSTLPLNLISATNQQKVSSNVQIKQKLPLKLASKFGGGSTSTTSSPSSGTTVTSPIGQIIPLKLLQGNESSKHPTSTYQKLSSVNSTPSPSHSRTGSSPAMMQNTESPLPDRESAKAERTNTYPKIPDRYRVQSPPHSKKNKPTPSEEEVIFF